MSRQSQHGVREWVVSQEEDQSEVVVIPVCGTRKRQQLSPKARQEQRQSLKGEGSRGPLSKNCSKRRLQNPQERKATSLKSGHHQASVSELKG